MPGLPKPRSPCAHRPLYSRYIRSHQLTALVHGIHCRIRGSGGGAGWATRRDTKLASGVSGAAVLRTLPLGGELLRKIVLFGPFAAVKVRLETSQKPLRPLRGRKSAF